MSLKQKTGIISLLLLRPMYSPSTFRKSSKEPGSSRLPKISSSVHCPCFTLNTPTLWWVLTKVWREREKERERERENKINESVHVRIMCMNGLSILHRLQISFANNFLKCNDICILSCHPTPSTIQKQDRMIDRSAMHNDKYTTTLLHSCKLMSVPEQQTRRKIGWKIELLVQVAWLSTQIK